MKRFGVIGAGILGLAVAYRLQQRHPSAEVVVFEKEAGPGMHQSGRNSGVLHSGLYYRPGSLKSRLAVDGIRSMVAFCRRHDIPHELCGKIVVASNEHEKRCLGDLAARGAANGLKGLRYLERSERQRREPCVSAVASLLVPEEGIVDYPAVMRRLESVILQHGGTFCYGSPVRALSSGSPVTVITSWHEVSVDFLISCGGLHADRLYQIGTGQPSPVRIVPFRGEYRLLKPRANTLVNHLVYPVPDPAYPFLGVHFTRLVHGGREVGPNAVFAFRREGYSKFAFSFRDTLDSLAYSGLRRFVFRNLRFTATEFAGSFSERVFVAKARKLIPDIESSHFEYRTSGVRAQAVSPDGGLVMDFLVRRQGNQVHVLNAPSPGATASLAIADYLVSEYVSS